MKTLIINLTRLGDIIQTIGLISSIKKRFPEATIDFLVMKSFSAIVSNIPNVDNIICFDEDIFSENIANDIWGSYAQLQKIITRLNETKYDVVLNPIVSMQSSILTYLIDAPQKLGQQMTSSKEQKMTCDSICYLLANQHNLGDYSYNLVDIFALMATEIQPLTPDQSSQGTMHYALCTDFLDFHLDTHPETDPTFNSFIQKLHSKGKKIIGFHIGASQSNKSWDTSYFHAVIERLLTDGNYSIVLFGGYKELDFKSYFDDITSPSFFNMIGAFTLNQLIIAISEIALLVTNDTGPMHIASARQIPVLDISLGPVSKWETGAYNPHAVIIEANLDCHPCSFSYTCPHWNCHRLVTPDAVYTLIKQMMSNRRDGSNAIHTEQTLDITSKIFKDVNIYTTTLDQFGFLSFIPARVEKLSEKQLIFHLKRFIWSLYFTKKLKDYTVDFDFFKKNLDQHYIIDQLDLSPYTAKLATYKEKLTKMIAELKKIKPNRNNQSFISSTLHTVKSTKDSLFAQAKDFEYIYDWFWFTLLKESQIEDFDVVQIADQTIALYEMLLTKIRVLEVMLRV